MVNNDIICAISTAPGNGAIAVVRLSGDESIDYRSHRIGWKKVNAIMP